MPKMRILLFVALLLGVLLMAATSPEKDHGSDVRGENKAAQTAQGGQAVQAAPQAESAKPGAVIPFLKETRRTMSVGGSPLDYTATVGILQLKDDEGKPRADLYFTAYVKAGASPEARPVTFAFNGGPGSSSMWLHMGALGPRRVLLGDKGEAPRPPMTIADNASTWLAFTDLVFIDPVGTGFSRAAAADKAKEYYSVQNDVESVGDFIRLYLSRYNRWISRKFLVGESYGTTRAAALTGYLHDAHGIDLNGVLLISPVLDFNTILYGQANDLAYLLALPSYTAAAWYHGKVGTGAAGRPDRPDEILAQSQSFALGEYAGILNRGEGISPEERAAAVGRLAALTGLSEKYIDQSDLRILDARFRKELLRDERLIIGRMDSRLTGRDLDQVNDSAGFDPLFDALIGPFSAAVNHYLRAELGFDQDLPYKYLNFDANRAWDYSTGVQGKQGYLNVSDTLARAMVKNRYLKVFVACGRYDLATPYAASAYTVDHLGLGPETRQNVSLHVYDAGHMVYVDKDALPRLTNDAAAFYRDAAGGS